ncbi:MAG: segregation/condensation protein A [Chloroflexota bacterium]|nr:segregation/condensation protein A [Chloroflexota bacterium]
MLDNSPFQVHLEVFDGPLDLLLRLIERRQLEISKVSLAEIANSFLSHLEAHPDMPPGVLASFVWVASKLLWIKSQALLPRPHATGAEDDEEDPGEELVRRLQAYRRVQEAAGWLRSREAIGLRSYERPASLQPAGARQQKQDETTGTGLDGVTLDKLVKLVQKRMQLEMPTTPEARTGPVGHTITVAEKVAKLRKRLAGMKDGERIPMAAEFVAAASRSRTELVVLFMAVLEIVRRKLASAEQDQLFGEIWITKL